MDVKRYISPGGWFSLNYPETWSEFEEEEGSFLFYNPEKWSGNFRISAYKDRSFSYAKESIAYDLENNRSALLKTVGPWKCSYSCETFMEGNEAYTSHFWITGEGNVSVECSFTTRKGQPVTEAERIIESLDIRSEKKRYPKEMIPVRILEINEINMAYEWVSAQIKKWLKKDFTASVQDIVHMQELINSGKLNMHKDEPWQAMGMALGVMLVNEMDGMDWVTVVDEVREYPALRFRNSDLVICPLDIFTNQVRKGEKCDIREEFDKIKTEVEKRL